MQREKREIMRILKSKELTALSERCGKNEREFSKELISELIIRNIIEDVSDNWGYNLFDAIDRDIYVTEIVSVLHRLGIKEVNSDDLSNLFGLILLGDGDCPICGGELVTDYAEESVCGGDGYLTPLEYETTYIEGHCKNCNYKFSN